eukprot:TRINITY_DN12717_c0_g1_i1.p1 TRINITY_DN12717_c0_g1~~TRINITY_DN12717_c0_g1_i1.p1  ORF type:complete len:282 (+),score=24.45 TRINITY_DN12717_c0_g1_i1:58-903(+)
MAGINWEKQGQDMQQRAESGATQVVLKQGVKDDELPLMHRNLASFWKKHSKDFCDWWTNLPLSEREGFVRTVISYIPHNEESLSAEERTQAKIFPELFLDKLCAISGPDSLIGLFEARAGCDFVEEQARDYAFVNKQHQLGFVYDPFVADGEVSFWYDGQIYQVQLARLSARELRDIRDKLARGIYKSPAANEVSYRRLKVMYPVLCLLADAFRDEILHSKFTHRTARKTLCQTCDSATNLKACTRCWYTYYCSRECQKADWQEHNKICKKLIPQIEATPM